MGYYKDTGSLWSMASAEAILKKRMPEKVGILPVAELLFVAESMWVGEHDMKGHFHPSFRFVKAKRYNAKPHVLISSMSGLVPAMSRIAFKRLIFPISAASIRSRP